MSAGPPREQSPPARRYAQFGLALKTFGLRRLAISLLITSIAVTLMGCASSRAPAATMFDSGNSLPTVIYLTAEAINSTKLAPAPTIDRRAEAPSTADARVAPTQRPASTPLAGPGMHLATIQIQTPGPLSRVVSPLQIQLVAVAGASKKLDVDLFGHDWRLLGHSLVAVAGSPAGDPLSLTMRFEIRTPSEKAFLQVSTRDANGRVQSETTLPLLLLSSGTNQINPPGSMIYERVVLNHLPAGAVVSGGVLSVQGELMPYNRHPAAVELVSAEGRSLGLRVLQFVGSDWQAFDTTIPYQVRELTPARLYVRQGDDILGEQAYIYSQEITLNP